MVKVFILSMTADEQDSSPVRVRACVHSGSALVGGRRFTSAGHPVGLTGHNRGSQRCQQPGNNEHSGKL